MSKHNRERRQRRAEEKVKRSEWYKWSQEQKFLAGELKLKEFKKAVDG